MVTRARARYVKLLLLGSVLATLALYQFGRPVWVPAYLHFTGKRTVEDVLTEYRPAAEARLRPHFDRAGLSYPPAAVTLLAFKDEKRLELWGQASGGWILIRDYAILGASGGPGPKLREGDLQVPEGRYAVAGLNPNSSYHLSLKLDYPNASDRARARDDGRDHLGGDIFIHGKTGSIGCLAMGDPAIEELFVLVERVERANVSVLIAPWDLRKGDNRPLPETPPWTAGLYRSLREDLSAFPPAS